MKKRIVLGICGLIISILLGCNSTQFSGEGTNNTPQDMEISEGGLDSVTTQDGDSEKIEDLDFELTGEGGEMNLRLIGSCVTDTKWISDWIGMSEYEDKPLEFFFQLYGKDKLYAELVEDFNMDLSKFEVNLDDYPDNYFAVTLGRELVEIQYEYIGTSRTMIYSKIVLAEEYEPQVLRLYSMDKIPMHASDIAGNYNAFYIMNGTEKVYHGEDLLELNSGKPPSLRQEWDDPMPQIFGP